MLTGTTYIKLPPLSLGRKGSPAETNLREPIPKIMLTLKEFATEHGFTGLITKVRVNTNNYPYLVFVTPTGTECIYFSIALGATLKAGQELGKAEFAKMRATLTTNASGEQRYKICFAGETPVTSVEDAF
jgi:hypothetical protein